MLHICTIDILCIVSYIPLYLGFFYINDRSYDWLTSLHVKLVIMLIRVMRVYSWAQCSMFSVTIHAEINRLNC